VSYKYNWSAVIEWSATALLIACVVCSSLNWYPANVFTGFLGNAGWVAMGVIWKKPSLVIISVVLAGIYVGGMFYYFFQ
jgi:hypothetical protein